MLGKAKKWLFSLSVMTILLLWSVSSMAQQTVSGTVASAGTGETLPGVNILIKGTSQGTSTDMQGHYVLEGVSSADTLVFSFIGFQTQTIPVNGRTTINVDLVPSTLTGQELVVVGYGTQQRRNITGSISQVEGSEIAQAPVSNVTQALSGNIAGVSITPHSGQPGQNNPEINIRGVGTIGNTQPLIVINGIPRDDMSTIDPSTIESITVLKDAAAVAPYGIGGANGVVLVETKGGQSGKPT